MYVDWSKIAFTRRYNRRADNITTYTKMAVEVEDFCCLLLY